MTLFRRKTPPDPYLSKPVITPRFNLVNCTQKEAVKITLPWRADPDILENMMLPKTTYSTLEWVRSVGKSDGHSQFYHAIVAKDIRGTIGAHRMSINAAGTVSVAIVIHARSWWGKGVFEEVRCALMDHFSGSDRVVRFYGRVLSRNVSSVYNYNKLGFRLIGFDRQAFLSPASGTRHDTLHYEMLATDWRAKRALDAKGQTDDS